MARRLTGFFTRSDAIAGRCRHSKLLGSVGPAVPAV